MDRESLWTANDYGWQSVIRGRGVFMDGVCSSTDSVCWRWVFVNGELFMGEWSWTANDYG